MAITWAEAKTRLRRSILKDLTGKKWDDATLLDFANLALDDLSGWAPQAKTSTLAGTGAVTVFALPGDFRRLESLYWYDGYPVPDLADRENCKGSCKTFGPALPEEITIETTLAYSLHWPAEGQLQLWQLLPAGKNAALYYGAYRAHLTGEQSNLPIGPHAWMEMALYCYIAMLANLRDTNLAALLEFFKSRSDQKTTPEIPYNVEAAEWYRQYRRLLLENASR